MNWRINKRMLAGLATGLFLTVAIVMTTWAWYPPYPNGYQGYAPYYPGAHPYYWYNVPAPGYYGNRQPRWYMRGRMNRYGDYRFDIRVRDMSMDDLYTAWMLYNSYGN